MKFSGGGGGGGGLSSLLGLFLILALLPVIVPAIQNLLGLRRSLDVGEEENR